MARKTVVHKGDAGFLEKQHNMKGSEPEDAIITRQLAFAIGLLIVCLVLCSLCVRGCYKKSPPNVQPKCEQAPLLESSDVITADRGDAVHSARSADLASRDASLLDSEQGAAEMEKAVNQPRADDSQDAEMQEKPVRNDSLSSSRIRMPSAEMAEESPTCKGLSNAQLGMQSDSSPAANVTPEASPSRRFKPAPEVAKGRACCRPCCGAK